MFFTGLEDKLINVSMECLIRQRNEFIDFIPVIVLLVRPLAFASILRIFPGQDTRSTRMKPESWIVFGMTFENAVSDCCCSALMIRSIRSIYVLVTLSSSWLKLCTYE